MDSHKRPRIVRIKRKRDDESLDALVVESKSRRKKLRGISDVFQYVETVEEQEFDTNPQYGKDLLTRFSSGSTSAAPNPEKRQTPYASPAKRYTILKPTLPSRASEQDEPIAKSTTDELTMYDAVLDTGKGRKREEEDPNMAKFVSLMGEYLRLNGEPVNTITTTSSAGSDDAETGYVYDVFLQRPVTPTYTIPANIATISGMPIIGADDSDSGSESPDDEDDEDSNTEDFYRNDYPDEDPDEDSDHHLSDYEEEYPELEEEDDKDDEERELYEFLVSRGRGHLFKRL